MNHLNPDFPYPAGHAPAPRSVQHPSGALMSVFEGSEGWEMSDWTAPSLITARAGLRHMLQLVERELGQRKLLGTTRETR